MTSSSTLGIKTILDPVADPDGIVLGLLQDR
jgi:hypothetical protein